MTFWKPGASAPGLGVGAGVLDRETENEAPIVTATTMGMLSIAQQRARLPIAAHRTDENNLMCSYIFQVIRFCILLKSTKQLLL